MNDKPNVLTLSVLEWKALTLQRITHLADGIATISDHLNKQPVINKQIIAELNAYWGNVMRDMAVAWDEVQLPLAGWEKHSRPIIAAHEEQQRAAQPQPEPRYTQPARVIEDGEIIPPMYGLPESPKRKGGWEKGKKRGPRKPKAQPPSAAALPPVTQ